MAQLLVNLPDGKLITHEVINDVVTIGREQDNTITIEDESISAHHALLTRTKDQYKLRDLKSTNGIQVNGAHVDQSELRNEDQLQFGNIKAVFRFQVSKTRPLTSLPTEIPDAQIPKRSGRFLRIFTLCMIGGVIWWFYAPEIKNFAQIQFALMMKSLSDYSTPNKQIAQTPLPTQVSPTPEQIISNQASEEKPSDTSPAETTSEIPLPEEKTPVNDTIDLTALKDSPGEWPVTVTLKEGSIFPAVLNGKVVGSVGVAPGAQVNLVSIDGEQVTVEYQGATKSIPAASTDLVERIRTMRRKPSSTNLDDNKILEQCENEIQKNIQVPRAQYLEAIKILSERFQRQGDLENTLAINNKLQRFITAKTVTQNDVVKEIRELSEIQNNYLNTVKNSTQQVVKRYTSLLEEKKRRATINGNLAEAVALKDVISKIESRYAGVLSKSDL